MSILVSVLYNRVHCGAAAAAHASVQIARGRRVGVQRDEVAAASSQRLVYKGVIGGVGRCSVSVTVVPPSHDTPP